MATLKEMQDALPYYQQQGDVEATRQLIAAIRAEQNRGAAAAAQVEDPGAAQSVLIGAGRTFDRVGKGMKQLYLAATGDKEGLEKLKQEAADDDQIYQTLQEQHPYATGFGEALPSVVVPAGGGAGLAATALRMGASAAIPAALEYGTPEERAKRAALAGTAGAVAPTVLTVAGRALKSLGGGAVHTLQQFTPSGRTRIAERTLADAVTPADAAAVAARLKSATPKVPGSLPTAAEVGESGGLAALQRSVKAAAPEAFTERGMEQAAARVNALRQVAGDEASLEAAKMIRSDAAAKSYKNAYMAGVDQDMARAMKPQIDDLLSRPSVRAARNEARKIAAEEGIKINDFGSVQGLHFLKESIDDQIGAAMGQLKKQRRLMQTKNDLMSVLEQIAPEYAEANARYARLSKPINRMQVGQELLSRVEPALNEYGGLASQKGENLARALRRADALTRQATGLKGAKYADTLTPGQQQIVQSVMEDLARASNAEVLGKGGGSDTVQKLMMNPRAILGLHGAMVHPALTIAAGLASKGSKSQINQQLAEVLMNPAETARLLERGGRSVTSLMAEDYLPRLYGGAKAAGDTVSELVAASPKLRRALGAARFAGSSAKGLPVAPAVAAAAQLSSNPVLSADDLEGQYLGE